MPEESPPSSSPAFDRAGLNDLSRRRRSTTPNSTRPATWWPRMTRPGRSGARRTAIPATPPMPRWMTCPGGCRSSVDLEKALDKHVAAFCCKADLGFDLGDKKLKCNSLWINILPEGGTHASHIHPHSVISGTTYVAMPEGTSALKHWRTPASVDDDAGPRPPENRAARAAALRPADHRPAGGLPDPVKATGTELARGR